MLSFHVKFVQTDRQTEGQTTVKQYAPDLSIQGHKNMTEEIENADEYSHFLPHTKFFFYSVNSLPNDKNSDCIIS